MTKKDIENEYYVLLDATKSFDRDKFQELIKREYYGIKYTSGIVPAKPDFYGIDFMTVIHCSSMITHLLNVLDQNEVDKRMYFLDIHMKLYQIIGTGFLSSSSDVIEWRNGIKMVLEQDEMLKSFYDKIRDIIATYNQYIFRMEFNRKTQKNEEDALFRILVAYSKCKDSLARIDFLFKIGMNVV